MKDNIEELLLYCSEINFGVVKLLDDEKKYYKELNNEIILLCKSLPESTQTDALLFLMRYSGISLQDELNFLRVYYAPAWSIIYWLIQSAPGERELAQEDIKNAIIAHSMAMILHPLDDHLNDNEMPVTHLALILRSQAWMRMNTAFNSLADRIDEGEKIVKDFINDYYSSICSSEVVGSLDSYCDLFRKQMATWLIVPVLLTKKKTSNEHFSSDIQTAYGSFGIAWRLLDDINDIRTDMMKCIHSSIYLCLPEKIKSFWDKHTGEKVNKNNGYAEIILDYIIENSIIDRVKQRIYNELESAASFADYYNMKGLADEFRCLKKPLGNR